RDRNLTGRCPLFPRAARRRPVLRLPPACGPGEWGAETLARTIGWRGRGVEDQRDLTGEAPAGPGGPGRLGPVHGALRPQDLRLVPPVEPPGGRRRGPDAGRPAEARGED